MHIEPFGTIDINNLEEYYNGQIEVQGENIEIDLNFESESVKSSYLEPIHKFLSDIDAYAAKAFKAISDDFELDDESGTARFYLQHHRQEFDNDTIIKIFGTTDIDKQLFLKNLRLYRVGLYPESDDYFAVFDIQLPNQYTDYLMAVVFDRNGKYLDITLES